MNNENLIAAINATGLSVHERFGVIHAALPVCEFKESWNNGTGYLDGAVNDSDVPKGVWAFNTGGENNRNGILITTWSMAIVMFERYTGGENGVLVVNVSSNSRGMWALINGNGSVSSRGLDLFGDCILAALKDD